jgi:hypothetical protein
MNNTNTPFWRPHIVMKIFYNGVEDGIEMIFFKINLVGCILQLLMIYKYIKFKLK